MATILTANPTVAVREPDPFVMWRRLRAILADSIIITVLTHFILVAFPVFQLRIELPEGRHGDLSLGFYSTDSVVSGVSVAVILYVLYFLVFETLTSATPGKLIAGVRVVDRSGGPISPWQVAVRNLFRPLDAAGAYALGGFVAALSSRRQRIGDHAAGTLVVSVESLTDERTTHPQTVLTMEILGIFLAVALLADAASAILPPRVVVAPNESVYPTNSSTISVSGLDAQAVHSSRVRLWTHSPGEALYSVDVGLIGRERRLTSCTFHANFVWSGPLTGWESHIMSGACRPPHS